MALFEKKFCDLCNEKVNILTRQKLADGFLCSDCKHKLSSLSHNWERRTVADVKAHLEEREANRTKYSQFNETVTAGKASELLVDAAHRQFCFTIERDYKDGNPEVFDFSQLQDFWLEEVISTDTTDSDGDGIPDSRDNFDNRTGRMNNNNNGMFGGMINAPMNVQQYIRRNEGLSFSSTNAVKYVSALKAHFTVKHRFINEITFAVDSSIAKNNINELLQAFDYGAQLMQLAEQIRGAGKQQQYGQPMQRQGFAQQSQSVPAEGWACTCGAVNTGRFCEGCGTPRPSGTPLYKCDKCGWEPSDPRNPPKFCPQCGDIFDGNDAK